MVLPGKTPRFELNLRLEGPRRPFLRALAVLSGASASAVASGAAKGAFLDLRVMGLHPRCSMYGIFTYITGSFMGEMLVNIPAP